MKRILSFICALVLLLTCFPRVAVSADGLRRTGRLVRIECGTDHAASASGRSAVFRAKLSAAL